MKDVVSRLTGGNRISQQVSGAHEGGIFSLCVLKDGTLVSGGGKDRKVALWGYDYRKQSEMEVRALTSGSQAQERNIWMWFGSWSFVCR